MATFVTYLESALDGTRIDASVPQNLYRDRPLWVRVRADNGGSGSLVDLVGAMVAGAGGKKTESVGGKPAS